MAEQPPRSPHLVRVVHATGGVIHGYKHLVKRPCPLPFENCDTVAKRPFTSTHLMLPYYTERQPSHKLMYTVDHTFGYHSQKFICTCMKWSMHAHGIEIRGGNFKQFKTSVGLAR